MTDSDQYRIEARSLRVAGVAGHNYWVLRAPDGTAWAELHGLATDRETGRSVPIGTDPDRHSLRVHHLVHDRGLASALGVTPTRETYVIEGQPSRTVLAAGREEVLARWNAAVAAREPLNALDLDYPRYGFRVFGETVNSNSTYRTLGEIMSVPVRDFPGRVEPGIGNRMTTPEHIERRRTHGYPQVDAGDRRGAGIGGLPDRPAMAHVDVGELLQAAGRGNHAELHDMARTLADSPHARAWLEAGREALARSEAGIVQSAGKTGQEPARQPTDAEPAGRGMA